MTSEKAQKAEFLTLYEKHADELFRYCYFKTSNREQSLEIVQEVFMKAWITITKETVMENPRAFLYAATRNAITDWYRKKKVVSLDDLHDVGFDAPVEHSGHHTDRVEVERILEKTSKLEEKYREVIILRFVNDLSVTEIAELLKETENNISVRLHRALEKLRKLYIKK